MMSTITYSNARTDTTKNANSGRIMKHKLVSKDYNYYTPSQEISKKDINFLLQAANVSHKSSMLMRHGCVVVENNRVIATGYNSYRTRFGDKFVVNSCSCHAEMHALRNALKIKSNKSCKSKKAPKMFGVRNRVGQRSQYEKGA
jgi:deoxycytidylate deaminase